MYCNHCKKELPFEMGRFCPYCGKDRTITVQQKKNPFIKALKILGGILLMLFMIFSFTVGAICVVGSFVEETESSALYGGLVILFFFVLASIGFGKLVGSIKSTFKIMGIVLGAIALLTLFIIFVFAPFMGNQNSLTFLSFDVIIALIVWLVIGIVKKRKSFIIFPVILAIVYSLMYQGVIHDIPYVIRHIQGEDFIGIWFVYACIVFAITFIVEKLTIALYLKNKTIQYIILVHLVKTI